MASTQNSINTLSVQQFGYTGIGTPAVTTQALTALLASATDKGIVVKGNASQSANMAEFQNSGGTAFLTVGPPVLSGSATTSNFLNITATMPTTMTATANAINIDITTAGTSAQQQNGMIISLEAGYTGASPVNTIQAINSVAGTGATYGNSSATNCWRTGNSNVGIRGTTNSSTTGINNGGQFLGYGSSTANYGSWTSATSSQNTPALNVGLMSSALNATTNCAGAFMLIGTGTPTFANTALLADNGATAADVITGRINGVAAWTLATSADVTHTGNYKLSTVGKAFYMKEGTGGFMGSVALAAGLATITIAGLLATDRVFITRTAGAGTLANGGYTATCTANTLTITAVLTTGTTQTLDTSTVDYIVFRQS